MISDDVAFQIGQHLDAANEIALAELGIFPAEPSMIGWRRNMLIRIGRAHFARVAAERQLPSAPHVSESNNQPGVTPCPGTPAA